MVARKATKAVPGLPAKKALEVAVTIPPYEQTFIVGERITLVLGCRRIEAVVKKIRRA